MTAEVQKLETPLNDMIARAVAGDHIAFGALYREFAGVVYATLAKSLGHVPAVEDLVQTVFLKVYRELSEFRGEKPFRSWLKRACMFVVYDHLRSTRSRASESVPLDDGVEGRLPEDEEQNPATDYERAEILRLTYAALETLKPEKRIALLMHDFEGHTMGEVAEVLGCSEFTVRTRLVRARQELTASLKKNQKLKQLVSRSVS
jgi:RNA polymerase sigma-70 factor (ECF subfamily)